MQDEQVNPNKQLAIVTALLFLMGIFVMFIYAQSKGKDFDLIYQFNRRLEPKPALQLEYPHNILLTSKAFVHEGVIPEKYSCKGIDVSPPLLIQNLPANTKSLVLLVDDPDATYKTWTHWIVFNIDPRQKTINENTVPWNSKLGTSDFGTDEYRGPCPPTGKHRYFFRIYALDILLDLKSGANRKTIEKAMETHIIDYSELVGVFEK